VPVGEGSSLHIVARKGIFLFIDTVGTHQRVCAKVLS
jgi:hypothetical protein